MRLNKISVPKVFSFTLKCLDGEEIPRKESELCRVMASKIVESFYKGVINIIKRKIT